MHDNAIRVDSRLFYLKYALLVSRPHLKSLSAGENSTCDRPPDLPSSRQV